MCEIPQRAARVMRKALRFAAQPCWEVRLERIVQQRGCASAVRRVRPSGPSVRPRCLLFPYLFVGCTRCASATCGAARRCDADGSAGAGVAVSATSVGLCESFAPAFRLRVNRI